MFKMSPEMLNIYNEMISTPKHCIDKIHACYECIYLLQKYGEFKTKCCTSYNILQRVVDGSFEVTEEWLNNIDRKQNKLESKLTITHLPTKCQKSEQQKGIHGADKKFITNIVKTETIVDSIEDNEDDLIIGRELEPTNIESCNVQDILNDTDQSKQNAESMNVDIFLKSTQYDVEDEFHSEDILVSDHNIFEDSANEVIKEEDNLDNSKEAEANSVKKDNESIDSNNDSDSDSDSGSDGEVLKEILARYSLKRKENEDNISKTKRPKRASTTKRVNVGRKTKTKVKNGNTATEKKIKDKLISDINNKVISKKRSLQNTKSLTNLDKTKKNFRYTFDASVYDDYATIVQLTPEDARREVLLRKESTNYKRSLYKCELCFRGFITEATYQTHMNKHSLDHGAYECDACQLRFTSKGILRGHRLSCHTRKFSCKICPYVCYSTDQAKNHICLHKGKEYPCKECGEVFRFPNSLLSHVRLKHDLELVCDLCGSTFASMKGLDVHKNLLHKKEKNDHLGPKCDECDVHFATELAWKRHFVLCSKHKLNGCGVCGDIFPDAASLRQHARSHGARKYTYRQQARGGAPEAELPAPCPHCDKQLLNNKMYKTHMTTEHPDTDIAKKIMKSKRKQCVCEVCGMTFTQPCFLIQHQRKHTGEKPFSCPDCGKRFTTLNAVKAHQPVHTNVYPYKCHICSRAFGDKGRLNKHVKYHSAIRPYKCTGCERTFTFQCEMRYHAMYVHNKVPWPKRDKSKRTSDKEKAV